MLLRPTATKWRSLRHSPLVTLPRSFQTSRKRKSRSLFWVAALCRQWLMQDFLAITRKKDLDKQVYATNICNPSRWLSALIACQLYLRRPCEAQSCPPLMSERARNAGSKQIFMKTVISVGWDLSEKIFLKIKKHSDFSLLYCNNDPEKVPFSSLC